MSWKEIANCWHVWKASSQKKPKRRDNQITRSRHSPLFAGYNKYYFGAKISPPTKIQKILTISAYPRVLYFFEFPPKFTGSSGRPRKWWAGIGLRGSGPKIKTAWTKVSLEDQRKSHQSRWLIGVWNHECIKNVF